MTRLREVFAALGLRDVETFIASGNVVFRSRSTKPAALEKSIEKELRKSLGFDVSTLIRTVPELSSIAAFEFPGSELPASTLYVGLLKYLPDATVRKNIVALSTPADEFRLNGREIYWLSRARSMASISSGARLEKCAGMPATFRNLSTIRKLAEKYCR